MLDRELLRILVCPETKEPVHMAGPELLDRVNRAIEAGTLSNRSGERVTEKVEAGLVREDGRVLYEVKDDIPIMLIDESIILDGLVA